MKTLIVAIDFSDITPLLVQEAEKLARCFGTRIYLMHIAAPDPDFVSYDVGPIQEREFRVVELQTEKKMLENLASGLRKAGADVVPLLIQGETAKTLLKEVAHLRASLLIMGTHGKGLAKTVLLGSTSHEVVQHTSCPVLLVPFKGVD